MTIELISNTNIIWLIANFNKQWKGLGLGECSQAMPEKLKTARLT